MRDGLSASLPLAEPLLVACSGGPDSMALLVAVTRSRAARGVTAAHFDHGLRPAAETRLDAAAVESLAARLGIDCVTGLAPSVSVADGGSEAAARSARYRWLANVCRSVAAAACVTGHTLDDQAETVLLRLARGTGLAGAAAMRAASPWPVEGGEGLTVVRPLLAVRRAAVIEYLEALELEPRSDPTNALTTFDRNRLRHHVVPQLRRINPRVDEALARFAELARDDDSALDGWAAREAAEIATVDDGGVSIQRRALIALPAAVGSRVLRQTAARLGCALSAEQVAQLLRLAARRGARISLAGVQAEVVGEALLLRRCRIEAEGEAPRATQRQTRMAGTADARER